MPYSKDRETSPPREYLRDRQLKRTINKVIEAQDELDKRRINEWKPWKTTVAKVRDKLKQAYDLLCTLEKGEKG